MAKNKMRKIERSGYAGGPSTVFKGVEEGPGHVKWTPARVRRVPLEVGPVSRNAFEQIAGYHNCGWADVKVKVSADKKWHRFDVVAKGRKSAFVVRDGDTPRATGALAMHYRRLNLQMQKR